MSSTEMTISTNKSAIQKATTPWFFGFTEEELSKKTLFAQFLRKSRRFYFGLFHRDYIQASIEARKGDCHRCGACCELLYKCPFLGHDSKNLPYCRIYGDLRPGSCKNYPFDRADSEIEQCGFKFK